jgi:TatD DNase family protein
MYCDSHGHWTDLRVSEELQNAWLRESLKNKLNLFMESGVDPEGWKRQIHLQKKYPNHFKNSFGLHPYFVAQNDSANCEEALNDLAQILPLASGLGETGLDFREQYIKNETENPEDRQIVFFENQIQLAQAFKKPLILHVVRAHSEALKVLSVWEADQVGGMVHAFNSSIEVARQYLDLNFLISVGGAITHEKNKKLIDAVKTIPLEKLLLESDCPDQAPEGWNQPENSPLSVLLVAKVVAEIKQIPYETVLEKTTENFKKLFT